VVSDGTGSDETASDGPASDVTASDGAATEGTTTDGAATEGAATEGAATDSAATDSPVADSPVADGEPGDDAPPAQAAAPEREGVLDLLGLLAYASLTAFFRLADDAALAMAISDKTALAEMAVAEFGHFQLLRARIEEMSADPTEAMRPFVAAIDAFHARTAPSDWLESLVKAYVGDGIAADFYRTVAQILDSDTRELVLLVLADTGHSEFVIARVREAIEADPRVAGRLALWARRLVGEALGQAQRVAADRQPLARMLVGQATSQLGDIGRMFARLTDAHAARMTALGLADKGEG
jgi:tRNA-(MS[2]IO[6]A)-hydroxylase (MiaE)-like